MDFALQPSDGTVLYQCVMKFHSLSLPLHSALMHVFLFVLSVIAYELHLPFAFQFNLPSVELTCRVFGRLSFNLPRMLCQQIVGSSAQC